MTSLNSLPKRPPHSHLDPSLLAALDEPERELLLHIATCAPCRQIAAHQLGGPPQPPALDPDVEAVITRMLHDLEAGARLDGTLAAIEEERRQARHLVAELRAHPEAWGTAATDTRYGTPEVIWHLLVAAESEAPEAALPLLHLTTEIALRLAALQPALSLHRELVIECRCALAQRLLDLSNTAAASLELERAAELLSPDLDHGRPLYCQALARVRRTQARLEEALALAQRAVSLFEDAGTSVALGRAQVELGWTLLQAGDPAQALSVFVPALDLLDLAPTAAAAGRLGLAVALLDTASPRQADPILAAADRTIVQVVDPITRLRLRGLAAQIYFRRGRRWCAIRRLLRVLGAFLNLSEDHDAAQTLLDLLLLCHRHQWLRILSRRELHRAFGMLAASPVLHRRAANVLIFLDQALQPPTPNAEEILLRARLYLEASRYLPAMPFTPMESHQLLILDWDELGPALRRTICREAGADETIGDLCSWQVETGLQERISWRYEVLQQARIVFTGRPSALRT